MTDVRSVAGGAVVPSTNLVQTDGITLRGDGSRANPLRATIAATFRGVSVDGATIAGSGVPSDPLRVIARPPSPDLPIDGDALRGTGGPAELPRLTLATATVAADGITIAGDGSPGDPLRAIRGDSSIRASFRDEATAPIPGLPVFFFPAPREDEIAVRPTRTSPAPPSEISSAFASAHGVIGAVHPDGTVQVSIGGTLRLTAAQWAAATGEAGGLAAGQAYFAAGARPTFLSRSPDPAPGSFSTRVGIAMSATTMLIAPSPPIQNLGDSILFLRFAGQPLIVGSAVTISGGDRANAAVSDASADLAQAIGVVAALDVNRQPIVQISGIATLDEAQWGLVTDTSPGMIAGIAYFVATRRRPGSLTAVAPTSGARIRVGIGLGPTRLALSAPLPQRLG